MAPMIAQTGPRGVNGSRNARRRQGGWPGSPAARCAGCEVRRRPPSQGPRPPPQPAPQAQAQVDETLSALERENWTAMDDPFQVFLTCYRVLRASGDARAAAGRRLRTPAATGRPPGRRSTGARVSPRHVQPPGVSAFGSQGLSGNGVIGGGGAGEHRRQTWAGAGGREDPRRLRSVAS
jgi:hypothetical protein